MHDKQFTGCEAGEDQPAVSGTGVSAQSVPRAPFSNQWLNGWLAWLTAGAILKWWRSDWGCACLTHIGTHTHAHTHTHTYADNRRRACISPLVPGRKCILSEKIGRYLHSTWWKAAVCTVDNCILFGCTHILVTTWRSKICDLDTQLLFQTNVTDAVKTYDISRL